MQEMQEETAQSLLGLNRQREEVIIIGGGPAGLSAAYELSNGGVTATVLEASDSVGGISRTVEYKGYLFDIGGHRFFTKVGLVNRMWKEILGGDLLERHRLSRIFYKQTFFSYPLEPMNALRGLGIIEAAHCALSFLWAKLFPVKPEADFATWVSNRFGKRLFKIFFEAYTEKVWGMPCTKLSSEWGAQRIQGLCLWSAVWNALKPKQGGSKSAIKTLIHEFQYPRRGPGMMWDKAKEIVESRGCTVAMKSPLTKIHWEP